MTEQIGKVTLDLTYDTGSDRYSDGDIEDRLLEIARTHRVDEFARIIEQERSWPVFYHLSRFRSNIINWLPFKKTDRVLEIGSGCGAITGALAERCGSVTCVDLSKKRSLVNAYRNQDKDNITIMVGNFADIEPHLAQDYDYVFLIGVFEYGRSYIHTATPYEDFMTICNRHRRQGGRMVIAIESQFGLKYWAGCREDHLGTYFTGLEGYHTGGSARTFTRRGLEEIVHKCGIRTYSFYYPYPDYKFPTTIYSDEYLPKEGELSNNLRNFDRDRMLLFDEKQVFDQIIKEGEFPLFSNSYLLVIGPKPQTIYAKFSNDRAPEYAIRTLIHKAKAGELLVEKQPDSEAAREHIHHTYEMYGRLAKRYEGTKVQINHCRRTTRGSIIFPFCKGKTLEELLDERLDRGDKDGFRALIEEYMRWLSYHEDAGVTNIDFIFPNILVDGDTWHVIDYEWTFAETRSAREIAFRAFYNYLLGSEGRRAYEEFMMHDLLGLTDEERRRAAAAERSFQQKVTGERASIAAMREKIGFRAYERQALEEYCTFSSQKYAAQVFFDYGEGFSPEHCVTLHDCYVEQKKLHFSLILPLGVNTVRIDPCSYVCAVTVQDIRIGEKHYAPEELMINGVWETPDCAVFATEDPNILLPCVGTDTTLEVSMEVNELATGLAEAIVARHQKKKRGSLRRYAK